MIQPFIAWRHDGQECFDATVVCHANRLRRVLFATPDDGRAARGLLVQRVTLGTRLLLWGRNEDFKAPLAMLARVRFDVATAEMMTLQIVVVADVPASSEPLAPVTMLAVFDAARTAEQRDEDRKQRERQRPLCPSCGR